MNRYNQQSDTYYTISDECGSYGVERDDYCLNCGRKLLYGWHEMCQQCNIHVDHLLRREFRRDTNAFTSRPDIRKKYRLP